MKISSNAAWLVACRLAANLVNLVLFVAVSRYFGPAGIGTYSYAFAIAGFVYVIGSLGLDEYGIREYSRLPQEGRKRFMEGLIGAQCCMLVVAAVSVGLYLAITRTSWAITGIVVSLAVYQLGYSLARSLFIPAIAEQRMAGPALAELFCRGGAFIVAAVAVRMGASLLLAMTAFSAFGFVLIHSGLKSARQRLGHMKVVVSLTDVKAKVAAVWSFAAAEICGQVFIRISLIALTLTFGEEVAGTYATGLKFVEVACMPLTFLGVAAYPRLSQLAVSDEKAFAGVAESFWMIAVLMSGLVVWGLYFVVPYFLVPMLGAKFAGSEPVLQHITVLAFMQLLEIVLVRLSLAADLNVARFKILAAGTCCSVLLNLWLVPRFEIGGAIMAGTASLAIINIMYAVSLRSRLAGALPIKPLLLMIGGLGAAAGTTWLLHGSEPRFVTGVMFLGAFMLAALPFLLKQVGQMWRANSI